jgi:hypothetical protein
MGKHGFKMGEFIGTNGFFSDVMGNLAPFGFIREYHNWHWTEYTACGQRGNTDAATKKDGAIAMFNADSWNGAFDGYYKNLKDANIGVSMCIQGGITDAAHKNPNWQGDCDPEKPMSYLAHAQSMFQHAARYGYNKDIDPNLVRVFPSEKKEIGLGYVKYYENWNEPDASWEPLGNGQFTGAMFAAMLSADYDGHMSTLGADAGIKSADPSAKVVLGGLAFMPAFENMDCKDHYKFTEDIIKWCDENRSEEKWLEAKGTLDGYVRYPFDVFNGHDYCENGKTGISPEDAGLYERTRTLVDYVRSHFPDVEIWMSEFGWDSGVTHKSRFAARVEYTDENGEVKNAGYNLGLTARDVQARWLIREYLILAAGGIDRATQFMLCNSGNHDENEEGKWFETSGFINDVVSSGSVDRKPSWYYVSALHHLLRDSAFKSVIDLGDGDKPAVYEFADDNGKTTYALWLTTSRGVSAKVDCKLAIGCGKRATAVELADKEERGIAAELGVTDGAVTVEVTEKPLFIVVE